MLHIAIDIRPLMSSNRTGVGEYTYELLNALFKIDHQNQYFLFYNSRKDVSQNIPDWKYDNVHYIHTHWPNKLFNLFQKIFKYPKIDKLITNHFNTQTIKQLNTLTNKQFQQAKRSNKQSDPTLQQLDCFFSPNLNFTSLSKNIKHILTIHDLSFELYPQYYSFKRRLWHWAINAKQQCWQAKIILTPSKNTELDLVEYFQIPHDKIKTIYPGINLGSNELGLVNNCTPSDKKEVKEKYNLPDNFILYLGTVEPRKNIIGLIKAFEKIKSQYPISNIQYLIIAGVKGWKNKKIYKTALQSKYADYIKFIGYIDPIDKPAFYAMAKVFIYPSFYEGFGFPVLEAMSCYTPVITSNRSSLPEITNNSAYLINPHKIDEISKSIKEMIENSQLREYYIARGAEVVKKYNWEETAKKFLETIS